MQLLARYYTLFKFVVLIIRPVAEDRQSNIVMFKTDSGRSVKVIQVCAIFQILALRMLLYKLATVCAHLLSAKVEHDCQYY